jgi:uncharacterized protein (TIGR01244 family)
MINEQKINDRITIGGRPSVEEIEDLKARGFRTIINLLTPDEEGNAHEERDVEDRGLTYSAVPVSPALLDDVAVARFSQAVDSSDGPVAVHCKSGGRAGVMTLLHLGVSHGWTVERTLEEAEKIGAKIGPDSPYREFFEGYIRRHSAGER